MAETTTRSYLGTVALTIGLGVLAVGGVNAVVDPFAMLDGPRIEGWNAEKTQAHMMGVRTEKSIRLGIGRYQAAIFGSSRAAIGIDPADPAFEGRRVFNAALHATSMEEVLEVFRFALAHQRLELAVVGLDFLMWNGARNPGPEFQRSAFAGGRPAALAAARLLSWDVLTASIETIEANREGRRAEYQPDGSLLGLPRTEEDRKPREAFDRVLKQFAINTETYGCFRYAPGRVAMVGALLGIAAEHGTAVRLFLSPVHAEQLQLLAALQLAPVFERWKSELAAEVARANASLGTSFDLWDFSGPTPVTTEAVPADGTEMQWYWESSHYRRALGSELLRRMLGRDASVDGVRLTPQNVDAEIASQRLARVEWAEAHPEERASIRRMVARTERGRRARCLALQRQDANRRVQSGAGLLP